MKIECKVCGVKIEKGKRLCAECEALVASLVANMKIHIIA